MVSKCVYRFAPLDGGREREDGGGGGGGGGGGERERERLHRRNGELHAALNACKNQISRYYHNRKWDQCKKFTNEYELVFTSSTEHPGLASHVPISRSFFKLWEMLLDYTAELGCDAARPMTAMFLAEGPGGFMESFAKYRADRGLGPDSINGITLVSKHKSIPAWKVQSVYRAAGTDIHVHRGADGTGDLYSVANIDHTVAAVGEASCDFITADGGFDFSNDFNNQEMLSARLIACEVYGALRMQSPGGAFVLKVYDMHAPATLRIMALLHGSYGAVRIVKPLTSRPANSEKYVLCTGFVGAPRNAVEALRGACAYGNSADAALSGTVQVATALLRGIVEYNTHYIARQVSYITRTLMLIRVCEAAGGGTPKPQSEFLRTQLQKSLRWCHKYNIPSSTDTLRRYYCSPPTAPPAAATPAACSAGST